MARFLVVEPAKVLNLTLVLTFFWIHFSLSDDICSVKRDVLVEQGDFDDFVNRKMLCYINILKQLIEVGCIMDMRMPYIPNRHTFANG